jgi:hypothetical protein
MPYKYYFEAELYKSPKTFNRQIIQAGLPQSENDFNGVNRPQGFAKQIKVTLHPTDSKLIFELQSQIPQQPQNYLRCTQTFSKSLASQPGVNQYVCGTHLLQQI